MGDLAAFDEAAVAVEADVANPVGAVQISVADIDLVAGRTLAESFELAARVVVAGLGGGVGRADGFGGEGGDAAAASSGATPFDAVDGGGGEGGGRVFVVAEAGGGGAVERGVGRAGDGDALGGDLGAVTVGGGVVEFDGCAVFDGDFAGHAAAVVVLDDGVGGRTGFGGDHGDDRRGHAEAGEGFGGVEFAREHGAGVAGVSILGESEFDQVFGGGVVEAGGAHAFGVDGPGEAAVAVPLVGFDDVAVDELVFGEAVVVVVGPSGGDVAGLAAGGEGVEAAVFVVGDGGVVCAPAVGASGVAVEAGFGGGGAVAVGDGFGDGGAVFVVDDGGRFAALRADEAFDAELVVVFDLGESVDAVGGVAGLAEAVELLVDGGVGCRVAGAVFLNDDAVRADGGDGASEFGFGGAGVGAVYGFGGGVGDG